MRILRRLSLLFFIPSLSVLAGGVLWASSPTKSEAEIANKYSNYALTKGEDLLRGFVRINSKIILPQVLIKKVEYFSWLAPEVFFDNEKDENRDITLEGIIPRISSNYFISTDMNKLKKAIYSHILARPKIYVLDKDTLLYKVSQKAAETTYAVTKNRDVTNYIETYWNVKCRSEGTDCCPNSDAKRACSRLNRVYSENISAYKSAIGELKKWPLHATHDKAKYIAIVTAIYCDPICKEIEENEPFDNGWPVDQKMPYR